MPRFLLVVTKESCSKMNMKAACYVCINMTNASVTDAFQKNQATMGNTCQCLM